MTSQARLYRIRGYLVLNHGSLKYFVRTRPFVLLLGCLRASSWDILKRLVMWREPRYYEAVIYESHRTIWPHWGQQCFYNEKLRIKGDRHISNKVPSVISGRILTAEKCSSKYSIASSLASNMRSTLPSLARPTLRRPSPSSFPFPS